MTTIRFILAVIVGIVGSLLTWNKPWKRAKGAFWLWWDSWHTIRVNDEQYNERMATCRKCPIFFRPLQTCGSPLRHDRWLGCWCETEIKNRASSASCWIRDHETHKTGYGWRDGL